MITIVTMIRFAIISLYLYISISLLQYSKVIQPRGTSHHLIVQLSILMIIYFADTEAAIFSTSKIGSDDIQVQQAIEKSPSLGTTLFSYFNSM